jgi:hypothetical protein
MKDDTGKENHVLSPEEEAAKAAILAQCDKLGKAGVTFVAVHFDGYGDDGATEEVKCFVASDDYAYQEHEPVEYDASPLQEHFEARCLLATRMTAADSETWSSMWPLARLPLNEMTASRTTRPRRMRSSHGTPTQTC